MHASKACTGPHWQVRVSEMSDGTEGLLSAICNIADVEDNSVQLLVDTIKRLLDAPIPPVSLRPTFLASTLDRWARAGPKLSFAIRQAGGTEAVLKLLTSEETGTFNPNRVSSICALAAFMETADEDGGADSVRKAFFDNADAVNQVVQLVLNKDYVWDAMNAASSLDTLCAALPAGIETLKATEITDRLVQLFDSEEVLLSQIVPLLGRLCTPLIQERLAELMRSYISALNPPSESQMEVEKGGKKKKKKKSKKYQPRFNDEEVWARFEHMSAASSFTRIAAVDAGAIKDATRLVNGSPDQWAVPLKALKGLVKAGEGYDVSISELLPRLAQLLLEDYITIPYTEILRLARAFLPVNVAVLVSSTMVRSLVRALGEFPNVFDDASELVDAILGLIKSPISRPTAIEIFRERLNLDDVEQYESHWGYSGAINRLVVAEDVGAAAVLEFGSVEYALRLLKSEDVNVSLFILSYGLRNEVLWCTYFRSLKEAQSPAHILQFPPLLQRCPYFWS